MMFYLFKVLFHVVSTCRQTFWFDTDHLNHFDEVLLIDFHKQIKASVCFKRNAFSIFEQLLTLELRLTISVTLWNQIWQVSRRDAALRKEIMQQLNSLELSFYSLYKYL